VYGIDVNINKLALNILCSLWSLGFEGHFCTIQIWFEYLS